MIETLATVESNAETAPGYRLLRLAFAEPIAAEAGQFAMLRAAAHLEPLLRRALAVYRAESPHHLSFLYQVLGRGTKVLSQVAPGGQVEILTPLGNRWPIERHLPQAAPPRRAIIVAGGIGSASVYLFAEQLARAGASAQLFFGAASREVAVGCGLEDFQRLGLPLTVTTDDGSLGESGFVTAPLERFLAEGGGDGAMIYSCGPWPMMRRTAEIAARYGVECYVSLEAPMGCGFGVCVGCVVAMSGAAAGYETYKRVCVDGPIFPAEAIRWEIDAMAH